jgi:hypothetical protein
LVRFDKSQRTVRTEVPFERLLLEPREQLVDHGAPFEHSFFSEGGEDLETQGAGR